jgi:myo-inositol-1(or 4)-monophosphatase
MVTSKLEQETTILLAAMRVAGAAVKQKQQSQLQINNKANNDIVTEADLLANDILRDALLGAFPADGWLSEETVDDEARLACKRVWIVDPIDGTREFATGVPEYALSVALVEDGVPILACVFNPATDELFHTVKHQGAWLNNVAIPAQAGRSPTQKLRLLASRSEYKRGEWTRFEGDCEVQQIGSIAYKLALVAAGRADATFSLGPKSEWDIAAGVLLVLEAGGSATDKTGQPFVFNNENVLVNGIVASAPKMKKIISELIAGC